MKIIFSILVLLGVANGCGDKEMSAEEMQKKIQSISGIYDVMDTDKMDTMGQDVHISFNGEDNSVSGNSGCNQFFGNFTVDGEKLSFKDMGQTKMYCEKYMEVERSFNNHLGLVRQYSFDGDMILLENEAGETLLKLKKQKQ